MSGEPRGGSAGKAELALVLLTGIWGATFLLVKDALGDADPMTFLALRFGIGGVLAAALGFGSFKTPGLLRAGVILGLFLFLGFVTQTFGLLYTTPSRSAFITGLSVVLVPFVSIFLYRTWPSPPALLGVMLAVAGLSYLTGASIRDLHALGKGDLLTGLCAFAYAFHITLTGRYAPRFPASALVAVQLFTVSGLALLGLPFSSPHLNPTGGFIWAVLFCAVVATAGAVVVQTWAQARTTAVRAALIYSLEPVFAAGYSIARGRERLSLQELVGGGLIVLGVLTAEGGGVLWKRWRP